MSNPSDIRTNLSTEVKPRRKRRHHSAAYKLQILEEADRCAPGMLGSLLRREGLYSSSLSQWRKERKEGLLQGLSPKKRGKRSNPKDTTPGDYVDLKKQNAELKKQLEQANLIIEFQKKASQIYGIVLNSTNQPDPSNTS